MAATRIASADSRDACDQLRAEAHSEAVVLYGPEVTIDAAHVPNVTNVTDPAATPSNGLQARISASYSFTDLLRGRRIEKVASATCVQLSAAEQLERVLAIGPRWGELESARAELAYLEAHAAELDALVQSARDRLTAQRTTAVEVDELRSRRNAIALRVADRKEAIALLEDADAKLPNLAQVLATYRSAALDVDRSHADVRDMQAWRFDVRGGAAGADRADWFAVIEVGYSLGGLVQGDADRRAVEAHHRSLAHDDRDAGVRVEQLRATMHRSVLAIDAELASIDDQLETIRVDQDRIADLDSARLMRDRYAVEVIELGARRAGALALRDARRGLAGE